MIYCLIGFPVNRETHYHGFLPSLRHPAVVDKDYQPELDKPQTEKGHVFSHSDQKDQVLCMPSNNTTKGENKDTNYKKKNNPLSREKSSVVDCTRKTRANDSLLELDRQLDINEQIFTDKSTLNEYRNRTNHAVINIKSPVESCRNASSPGTYIPINIEDNASLNQHQQSSASEGMITRETIISDICISKRENNNLQDAKSSPNNGRPEKELDDLCYELGWTLPQYRVLPSILDGRVKDVNFYSGMFQATVTLKGLNFECTVNGDMKSSHRAARSSAATHMFSKLLSMARSQAQAQSLRSPCPPVYASINGATLSSL